MPPDRLNFANLIPSEKGVPNPNIPKKEKRPPKAKAYELIRIESPNTSPNSFYLVHSKPILIIELTSNNGGSITIEPQWYFYDTAWKVLSQGKERYVGYEYIMAFLKDIQYDKYPFFWERFYLLFQIADAIKEKRAKVAMEKRSALPSAAISSTVRNRYSHFRPRHE